MATGSAAAAREHGRIGAAVSMVVAAVAAALPAAPAARLTCHASCVAPLSQHLAWQRNTALLSGRMRLVSQSAISRCIVSWSRLCCPCMSAIIVNEHEQSPAHNDNVAEEI